MATNDKLTEQELYLRTQTTPSPINLKSELVPGERALGDWNRLDAGPVRINGIEIKELVRIDRGLDKAPDTDKLFENTEQLRAFFEKHLLHDFPIDTNKKIAIKKQALDYTMAIMHQGALLAPVTAWSGSTRRTVW